MKKIAILIILVVIAGAVYFYTTSGRKNNEVAPLTKNDQPINNTVPAPDLTNAVEREVVNDQISNDLTNDIPDSNDNDDENTIQPIKVFNISGENFKFSLTEITVNKGDTVKINFTSASGFHDWTIDEFKVATKQLNSGDGGADSVTFVADKAGTFEYYCSVGQHRAAGMVGKLIVK